MIVTRAKVISQTEIRTKIISIFKDFGCIILFQWKFVLLSIAVATGYSLTYLFPSLFSLQLTKFI